MNEENINKTARRLKIIIAPLDWGLGHATRCIPIIRILKDLGHEVFIAGSGLSLNLLKQEFPALQFHEIPAYNVRLGKSRSLFNLAMISQIPAILKTRREENQWLKRFALEQKPDLIISDNRFGFHHQLIPSVYITHQLQIKTGHDITDKIATGIHKRIYTKFKRIWVPDFRETPGLAGDLSHPKTLSQGNVRYLGPVSRMKKTGQDPTRNLLCLVSGPEPQRSFFEQIILDQANRVQKPVVLLRGRPGLKDNLEANSNNLTAYTHLPADELGKLIQNADRIICRSGYSTIMDLFALGQFRALLVPTPGQSEQEYLAKHLQETGLFHSVRQEELNLSDELEVTTGGSEFLQLSYDLKTIIQDEINSLCS